MSPHGFMAFVACGIGWPAAQYLENTLKDPRGDLVTVLLIFLNGGLLILTTDS